MNLLLKKDNKYMDTLYATSTSLEITLKFVLALSLGVLEKGLDND